MYSDGCQYFHFPCRVSLSPSTTCLATARISAKPSSAVVFVSTPGVLDIATPEPCGGRHVEVVVADGHVGYDFQAAAALGEQGFIDTCPRSW